MSTKVKAFIGILVSFVFLIILFNSTGGYRASRAAEQKRETCAALEKAQTSETTAQVESETK